MAWRWVLAAILVTSSLSFGSAHDDPLLSQWHFTSKTLINNVVLDPSTSRLYVGAVNALYQLDQSLHVEAYASTGPKNDNRQCTPPVTPACEEAVKTDNHNKLLLIHPSKDTLIVCGSLFRGICSLRNLSNVDQLLYFSDTKGEKTYVASAEESVSVIHPQGCVLPTVSVNFPSLCPSLLRLPSVSLVFKDGGFVYFLFSRTLSDQDSGTKNFTFISRMCENDHNYYSYTELQLNCSVGNAFNKAQAVYVSLPGEALARNMSSSGKYGRVLATDKVMFVVFSSDDDSSRSALCLYPLKAVNQRLVEVIEACYSGNGNINSTPAVYSPYSNKKKEELAITHRCGAEFLPSPLASRVEFGLAADPVFIKKAQTSGVWSAVAVTVETEHTVAFLGSTSGEVWKLHLSASPEIYGHAPGDNTGEKVNKNLLFNNERTHLYITTETKARLFIQSWLSNCKSCMSLKDPYCGWCVLKGKCTRRSDCPRSDEEYTWLWSPNRMCVQIQAFSPPNLSFTVISCIGISVYINEITVISCIVISVYINEVTVISCIGINYVAVPVRILVNGDVEVTSGEYKFYNCAAAIRKSENTPCIACVTSEWRCQWKAQEHTCADSDAEHLNEPQQVGRKAVSVFLADSCPQFENPEPKLVPVGHRIPISFEGKNLDIYAVSGTQHSFRGLLTRTNFKTCLRPGKACSLEILPDGTIVWKHQKEVPQISLHFMVLYNCSLGREDCSLCKHAHPKYNCVWCPGVRSCVYRELCPSPEPALCPDPKITDIIPHFGPLNGKISVTIKGSNLGIKKEDIKKVTVAGVDCVHQEDRYSVSTRCGTGGSALVWCTCFACAFCRNKTSVRSFMLRDPIPLKVSPVKGPAAGGTYVTISGTDLDTATKDDVAVTIGGTPCDVLQFGAEIVCETGANQGLKVPSEPLLVTVKYGKNTTKEVPVRFQYFEDPKVTSFNPKASFGLAYKNDTVLEFESPEVNMSQAGQLAFRTLLQLDNVQVELKNFMYHTNPTFDRLAKDVITETSIIIVTVNSSNTAMTAEEAQAFVGDAYCKVTILQEDKLILDAPSTQPKARSKSQRGDTSDPLDLTIKFGKGEWVIDKVRYEKKYEVPLAIIIPAVLFPMVLFIAVSVYCYWRKSQQAEREYEKVKHQLENLEESVRDRCKKEFTDLMIEMEDHTNDLSEARIPFLDYKTYTDRVFFLPSKDGANDVMITGKLDIPEARAAIVALALNQFSNLLNSKTFLINFIKTLESRQDFSARSRVYFASLLTVALHGKLEYYTDIMTTLLLELMEEHVHSKNPKLMLRRSETVVERMLCNWMSICLYQFLRDSAGEPLYKLFKAIKHQVEKGPVDAKMKKAKYTLNDTGLLGDDVEYCVLTLQVLVHGEGPDVTPVKVLNCDTISQVKEKIIEQVYRNLPYSQRPNTDSVALEWRPGSTGQILSDMDLTSQKEGRWKRLNTLAHYNVRDNATLVLSRVLHHRQFHQNPDSHEERNALLEDDKVFHLVRPADELDEVKSKRGSLKAKTTTKAITEIYLTRLLSVKGTLQQFVDDFFRSVLCSGAVVPPAVKYFFDFLDEQALKHENVEEETIHIWKTNSLPLRFWVNILKNPHFIFDIHVTEVVDASLSVIAQTFMDACTKTEHKLSRESPSNKLLYAKEISTYKKMVDDYYKGIRQMVPVSDQDMNTHLAEVSRQHTDKLNTQAALHQLYQYASKYYDGIIQALEEDPAAQSKQLTVRLQQIAAALENKVTDL
uniref:Plexin b2a, tandem duplicate 1 n=1 Tax=Esox lucius TaxID=8010 RepID=A0A6Q2XWD0_ESOLU